ncbi:MAG TPA: hypothetical protein VGF99_18135 [Myxococcota bacterium]
MSRRPAKPASLDHVDAFDTVSIPVVSDLDGVDADGAAHHAIAVVDWSAKHLASTAAPAETDEQERLVEASYDDLGENLTRLEADIAAHQTSSQQEAQRRALGYGLAGLLVGGLIGGAITAAVLRRR